VLHCLVAKPSLNRGDSTRHTDHTQMGKPLMALIEQWLRWVEKVRKFRLTWQARVPLSPFCSGNGGNETSAEGTTTTSGTEAYQPRRSTSRRTRTQGGDISRKRASTGRDDAQSPKAAPMISKGSTT